MHRDATNWGALNCTGIMNRPVRIGPKLANLAHKKGFFYLTKKILNLAGKNFGIFFSFSEIRLESSSKTILLTILHDFFFSP